GIVNSTIQPKITSVSRGIVNSTIQPKITSVSRGIINPTIQSMIGGGSSPVVFAIQSEIILVENNLGKIRNTGGKQILK
ncbi:MAG: hypothetical protein CVT48_03750, partial [Thermoplasmata archaeon HGW-Thermoplasmata-1]